MKLIPDLNLGLLLIPPIQRTGGVLMTILTQVSLPML
jgi:hypothetical protein